MPARRSRAQHIKEQHKYQHALSLPACTARSAAPTWQEDEDGSLLPLLALINVRYEILQQIKVQAVLIQKRQVAHHAGAAGGQAGRRCMGCSQAADVDALCVARVRVCVSVCLVASDGSAGSRRQAAAVGEQGGRGVAGWRPRGDPPTPTHL